jgi:hypothetical protein
MSSAQLTALALGLGGWVAGGILLLAFWLLCKVYDKWSRNGSPSSDESSYSGVVKKNSTNWEKTDE